MHFEIQSTFYEYRKTHHSQLAENFYSGTFHQRIYRDTG
jgi:hypothetical protein